MITIDQRCTCARCEARTGNVYRMVGYCSNCGQKDILFIFRSGDSAHSGTCPTCGGHGTAQPQRLATPEEIPAA